MEMKRLERFMGIAVFLLSLLWFYYPAEYILIANQDLGVFMTTLEHFTAFLERPGGILEYAGNFLNQFLQFRLVGAMVLSGIAAGGYLVTNRLIVRASGERKFLILGIITPILFVGMHHHYPHHIFHSAGLIACICMALLVPVEKGKRRIFLLLAVPIFYLAMGGFIWLFMLLLLVMEFSRTRNFNMELILLAVLYPLVIILAASRMLYLDPLKELMNASLPLGQEYGTSVLPAVFTAWILLLTILSTLPVRWNFLKPSLRFIPEVIMCLASLVLVLHFTYHRRNAEFFHIEKMALNEDWDGILRYAAQHPSMNLFGSFYTNLALANNGLLCSQLFNYPQPFGRRGLCFGWEAKGEILKRGSDFFWAIHLVNEAHHWAFESMIIDGFTRRNLKRLIQTELVRGNYIVAEKYVDMLGGSLFNRAMADHYRTFLNDPRNMEADPELGPRLSGSLGEDFFTDGIDLERNLKLLLENNPANRPALDYLMALFLLEKEVEEIVGYLPHYLELNGGRVPVLLDESLMVFMITHREERLSGMKVSPNTVGRFEEYTAILRQYRDQDEAARRLYPSFKSSFWFYMNFSPTPPK